MFDKAIKRKFLIYTKRRRQADDSIACLLQLFIKEFLLIFFRSILYIFDGRVPLHPFY